MNVSGYKDFSIKAKCTDRSRLEHILKQLNARFVGEDHQHDTYFAVERGKLKHRKGDIENIITHYERFDDGGMHSTKAYRYDTNPSAASIEELYATHDVIGTFEKIRRIFFLDTVKVHLDLLPSGECFVEIEAQDLNGTRDLAALKKQAIDLATTLGIRKEEWVTEGYILKAWTLPSLTGRIIRNEF